MTAAIEHVQAAAFDLDGTLCDSVPDLAAAAEAYKDVIARLLGENREMRFLEAEKKGFLKRLFGG